MSSTNRGCRRHKCDYYITPRDEIKKFLKKFIEVSELNSNMVILDPCCGGDSLNNFASYPVVISENMKFKRLITCDIREDSVADIKGDYLNINLNLRPDMIITNPPFNISEDIIKKSIKDVKSGGYVVMLLRLNFFGSKQRNNWLLNNTPKYCFIHSKRMSFTNDGKKDSIEYAHFVWQKDSKADHTDTYLLEY